MSNAALNSAVMNRSRLPLYLQLAAEFRRCIDSGMWPRGERLPTLETLMQSYDVSRMTLRQALSVLESEGLIRRARGKGTFVEPRRDHPVALAIPTSWQEAVALSDVLGTQSITEAERAVGSLPDSGMCCQAQPAPKYQYLCRLHSTNGQPFCYSEVYVEDTLFRAHRKKFKSQAAASVIARVPGLEVTESRQKLTLIHAGFQSANALRVNPGDSVAEVRRLACADGVIIYYARLEFPPRFVELELDLLAR
ncbi:GntR family transcriptional regulator [Allopusillimonas soli]|uniref:GntR family transcriptional regulator n=1 Tax=Allopusillimonas soli TaxID=659016 RepID=A0A853F8Y3_9BURK|nr:GntR family transcriptional regulator [Allopusillimonas soli]NYT36409.1 GntR family transcriptional regulator [Allopusillimonas soli]TEA74921.1 GntR family transcriptional regulator [Allopusillimonas soli]